jgi:nitroimidazol reductase NimA-like FMN-containing flavoprotein (pyridoxamine 5'-phosphate oxidase superfamily)
MIGELTADQIEEMLHGNHLARLACNDGFRSYIVPVSYVYDGSSLVLHSQPGKKIRIMRDNPQVCLLVDEIRSATSWKSVVVTGMYRELVSERERFEAMRLFIEKTLPLKISETAVLPEVTDKRFPSQVGPVSRPVIYRIIIDAKTGRFEKNK